MDKEMAQFVRFAAVFPSGEMFFDLSLQQIIPVVDHDMSKLMAYLDLPNIFHEVGVDLTSAGAHFRFSVDAVTAAMRCQGRIRCPLQRRST